MAKPVVNFTKTFITCGMPICIPITGICNTSKTTANEVEVTVETPVGLNFENADLPRGLYDEETSIWTIGTLVAGETLSDAVFCYTVKEALYIDNSEDVDPENIDFGREQQGGDCYAPYNWTITIQNGDCIDCNPNDNSYCVKVDGLTCCQVKSCVEEGILNCSLLTP